MKQKARIDILDLPLIEETADIPDVSNDVVFEVSSVAEVKKKGRHWLFRRWYWLVGALFVIVLTGIVLWFSLDNGPAASKPARRATVNGRPAVGMNIAVLDHFVVDLIDEKGNVRLLLCGFSLEMDTPENARATESRADIRAFIYDTIHKHGAQELKNPDARRALKKEIMEGLNPILGADKVKFVYVLQFLIL